MIQFGVRNRHEVPRLDDGFHPIQVGHPTHQHVDPFAFGPLFGAVSGQGEEHPGLVELRVKRKAGQAQLKALFVGLDQPPGDVKEGIRAQLAVLQDPDKTRLIDDQRALCVDGVDGSRHLQAVQELFCLHLRPQGWRGRRPGRRGRRGLLTGNRRAGGAGRCGGKGGGGDQNTSSRQHHFTLLSSHAG